MVVVDVFDDNHRAQLVQVRVHGALVEHSAESVVVALRRIERAVIRGFEVNQGKTVQVRQREQQAVSVEIHLAVEMLNGGNEVGVAHDSARKDLVNKMSAQFFDSRHGVAGAVGRLKLEAIDEQVRAGGCLRRFSSLHLHILPSCHSQSKTQTFSNYKEC